MPGGGSVFTVYEASASLNEWPGNRQHLRPRERLVERLRGARTAAEPADIHPELGLPSLPVVDRLDGAWRPRILEPNPALLAPEPTDLRRVPGLDRMDRQRGGEDSVVRLELSDLPLVRPHPGILKPLRQD